MQSFVLVSEEAISKGIRRIVAITGPEALKSQAKCQALEEQVQNLQNSVQEKMNAKTLKPREAAQEISRLGEVSAYRGPTLDRGKKCRKNEPKRSKARRDWVYSCPVCAPKPRKREDELSKQSALNSSFCAVTADSQSR